MTLEYSFFYLFNVFLQASPNSDPSVLIGKWFLDNTPNTSIIVGSLAMGTIGSTAYLIASKLGFIKFNRDKKFVDIGYAKSFGYALVGGAVATVFQLPELPNFTPIQSFVLGITWPLLVAQYTSSKIEPTKEKTNLMAGWIGDDNN